MKHNFLEAESEMFIGNLVELDLGETPRVGEEVAFAADGQSGEVVYVVEKVKRIYHRDLDGTLSEHIDVYVRPAKVMH